ncbi:MAG: hypothetical protein ACJ74Y_10725 [Bryobacteraceae bacterium]
MNSKAYLLTCIRAGRRHYVTGNRAGEGRWTKFKHRARRFATLGEAVIAKGKSQAEIIRA